MKLNQPSTPRKGSVNAASALMQAQEDLMIKIKLELDKKK